MQQGNSVKLEQVQRKIALTAIWLIISIFSASTILILFPVLHHVWTRTSGNHVREEGGRKRLCGKHWKLKALIYRSIPYNSRPNQKLNKQKVQTCVTFVAFIPSLSLLEGLRERVWGLSLSLSAWGWYGCCFPSWPESSCCCLTSWEDSPWAMVICCWYRARACGGGATLLPPLCWSASMDASGIYTCNGRKQGW